MVSSLIGPQYHQNQFWTFSESAAEGHANEFDVPVVPAFNDDFEVDTELNETGFITPHFSVCPFPWDRGHDYSL